MDKLLGVIATTSGFAGGKTQNPTYDQVGHHDTGHLEVVHVIYDPQIVTYGQVLDWFLHHVDPTDGGGQFCDRGEQYSTAIFPQDASQAAIAKQVLDAVTASAVLPAPVQTKILEGHRFWPAEVYHQDFSRKNPQHYLSYRQGCGRDDKVAKIWAKARGTAPAGAH
jgi:peptide-methionine (S)-S-oxide reductase